DLNIIKCQICKIASQKFNLAISYEPRGRRGRGGVASPPARQPRPQTLIFFFSTLTITTQTMKSVLFVAAGALCVGTSAAFTTAPSGAGARPATSLSMAKGGDNNGKTFAASALAAAYLLTGVVSADAAFAMDGPSVPAFSDSSSVMISARSGGRAGGRSMARPAARPAASTTKVINQRTTVIAPPPVVVGGGYGYGGYGGYYDPTPGIGQCLDRSLLFSCP
ncbi:hypothetical protein ACHAWF_018027, partial [Thalassiosira exigua]